MNRTPRGHDDGAALIVVLVMVSVMATGLAALLSFADTSMRATVNLRDQATASADADGAVQAAVTKLRNSTYHAALGTHCFGAGDTLSLPSFDGTNSAAVACTAEPATVRIQCPSLSNCNRPGNAILTLGSIAGEDGLVVDQPATSGLLVHGTVFSNSTINVVKGRLSGSTAVYARGACSGTISSNPSPYCSYTGINALGDDPGYAPPITTVPAHQNLPACTTPNSVVTFTPGYYDDAAGLNKMMKGNSSCRNSTWWFKPGAYYFDFHNAGANASPLLDSNGGNNVWTMNDGYLVGGIPLDSTGAKTAAPANPAAIPGACDNPISDPAAVGVQFIFGGDSQFVLKAGQAEICGTYSASRPPVALYGLTSGSDSTTTASVKPTGVPAPGSFGSTATAANLVAAGDAKFATWTAGKKNDSGTMTVDGFAPATAIPAGSVLKSANLRIVHRHSDSAANDSITVAVTPSGGTTAVNVSVAGHPGSAAWQADTADLDPTATGQIASAVYAGTFTGAKVAMTATLAANKDVEDVDSIQLDLSYTVPALRAETGCVTTGPYTGGSVASCALLSSTNSPGSQLYVQGTTYAPKAVIDLQLNNVTEQIFRFGVVARSLRIKQTGSFAYAGPVIEVPDDAPGYALMIYLTAYVCPGASTCSGSGPAALRSKITLVDADPTNPVRGQRQVAILSWAPTG